MKNLYDVSQAEMFTDVKCFIQFYSIKLYKVLLMLYSVMFADFLSHSLTLSCKLRQATK